MNGDWCTTDGAHRLKEKIESYWRDKGYEVDINLVEAGFIAAMRSGRTDVRSNMINGMPTRQEVTKDASHARRKAQSRSMMQPGWVN